MINKTWIKIKGWCFGIVGIISSKKIIFYHLK